MRSQGVTARRRFAGACVPLLTLIGLAVLPGTAAACADVTDDALGAPDRLYASSPTAALAGGGSTVPAVERDGGRIRPCGGAGLATDLAAWGRSRRAPHGTATNTPDSYARRALERAGRSAAPSTAPPTSSS